jgi:hypothetical protein
MSLVHLEPCLTLALLQYAVGVSCSSALPQGVRFLRCLCLRAKAFELFMRKLEAGTMLVLNNKYNTYLVAEVCPRFHRCGGSKEP